MEFNEGGYASEGVETVLRRRGHLIAKRGDPTKVIFSENRLAHARFAYEKAHGVKQADRVIGRQVFQHYTKMYGRTGMRRMLQRLIAAPSRTVSLAELKLKAGKRCGPLLEYLAAVELVDCVGEDVRLLSPITDLGPSLEQYVRMVCMAELRGHAEWGVSLEGVGSGDFDVIAWLPPTLVHFECKASNPNNIEADSLRQALQRVQNIAPDLAILVIDTDDDIASIASKIDKSGSGKPGVHLWPQRHAGGIYYGTFRHWPVYAINADPSISTNIRRCLRHFHSYGKWGELESLGAWSMRP